MCVPVRTTYQPCGIILYQLKLPQSLVRKSIQKCISIVYSLDRPGVDLGSEERGAIASEVPWR